MVSTCCWPDESQSLPKQEYSRSVNAQARKEMAAAPPQRPVVRDESWQCAKTPTLPFLGFHEHTALRPIGEVTISMPASPFFSLFLADDVKPGERARHDGGQSAVVFGKWSKHGACRERRVQYACDGVAIREAQRCTFVKDDGLILEARCWAAANPGAARAAAPERRRVSRAWDSP